jgi:glutathione S-transferase
MQYGRNDEVDYLRMNPNGRVPTLVDGTFVLWKSNTILRYLALQYGASTRLYPLEPALHAGINRWLDWSLSTLAPVEPLLFQGTLRTPPEQRNAADLEGHRQVVLAQWRTLNAHLDQREWLEGEDFSLADLVLGTFGRRWFGLPVIKRPELLALDRWYAILIVFRRPTMPAPEFRRPPWQGVMAGLKVFVFKVLQELEPAPDGWAQQILPAEKAARL